MDNLQPYFTVLSSVLHGGIVQRSIVVAHFIVTNTMLLFLVGVHVAGHGGYMRRHSA